MVIMNDALKVSKPTLNHANLQFVARLLPDS